MSIVIWCSEPPVAMLCALRGGADAGIGACDGNDSPGQTPRTLDAKLGLLTDPRRDGEVEDPSCSGCTQARLGTAALPFARIALGWCNWHMLVLASRSRSVVMCSPEKHRFSASAMDTSSAPQHAHANVMDATVPLLAMLVVDASNERKSS